MRPEMDKVELSAQLGRRSRTIHFPRYRLEQTDDGLAFRNVLYTFQQALPLPEPPDLVAQLEPCYVQSAGCVGVLKEWLNRALALALEAGLPTLTPTVLAQASLSLPTRLQLAREIQDGEAAFVTTDQQQTELRALLGMLPPRFGGPSYLVSPRWSPPDDPRHKRRAGGGIGMLTSYPDCDLTRPVLPPLSRLYALEPMGMGTPLVEGLASYVMRLAAMHQVTPATLIEQEIVPHGTIPMPVGGRRGRWPIYRTTLGGFSRMRPPDGSRC